MFGYSRQAPLEDGSQLPLAVPGQWHCGGLGLLAQSWHLLSCQVLTEVGGEGR